MRASPRSRAPWSARRSPFPSPPERTAPAGAAVYRRREPTATPLYPIVQHHLETFLAEAAEADPGGEGVPGWVEDDFRAYLRCGILAWGFARVRCDACAAERLVAFSCKGRGVCPSCNARRMVDVAAHLTDHVLPPLPVRRMAPDLRASAVPLSATAFADVVRGGSRKSKGMPQYAEFTDQRLEDIRHYLRQQADLAIAAAQAPAKTP